MLDLKSKMYLVTAFIRLVDNAGGQGYSYIHEREAFEPGKLSDPYKSFERWIIDGY